MGLFINFEGIDGAGKTTQIQLLQEKLNGLGIPAVFIREPGSTAIGEKIRGILLSPESGEMSPATELLLYAAARAQLTAEVIKPALSEQKVVVCDRYIHSSLAYQGFGSGYDTAKIYSVNREATGSVWPDLTFILDIEVGESLRRRQAKNRAGAAKDRIEQRDSVYYDRVRKGYLTLAEKDPERVIIVPSHLSVDNAHFMIWEIINGRITGGI